MVAKVVSKAKSNAKSKVKEKAKEKLKAQKAQHKEMRERMEKFNKQLEEQHVQHAWEQNRRKNMESTTRSCTDMKSQHIFVGFDVAEELVRFRRAAYEGRHDLAAQLALNIDEWLSHGGELPRQWNESRELFVAPNGSDKNRGTKSKPKKTLKAAVNAMSGVGTVVMGPGVYGASGRKANTTKR